MTLDNFKKEGLFEYNDDWKDKYLHPDLLTKDWDLIIDEYHTAGIPRDILIVPIFTQLFCTQIIELANLIDKWGSARHVEYKTNDMELVTLAMHYPYIMVLNEYIYPAIVSHYGMGEFVQGTILESSRNGNNLGDAVINNKPINKLGTYIDESFIVKYIAGNSAKPDHKNQRGSEASGGKIDLASLGSHTDDSVCTINVTLNEDFTGGGIWFCRQKALIKPATGYGIVHPGCHTHRHGALSVLDGVRYIIVSFLNKVQQRDVRVIDEEPREET